jgi:hypothetical protein
MPHRVVRTAYHRALDPMQGFPIEIQTLSVLLRRQGKVQRPVAQTLDDMAGAQLDQLDPHARVLRLIVTDAFLKTRQHGGQ